MNSMGTAARSQGPGHVDLFSGTETGSLTAALKKKSVQGGLNNLQTGEPLGSTVQEPEVNPDSIVQRGRKRLFSGTRQDTTTNHRILPRHRGAVQRYFGGNAK